MSFDELVSTHTEGQLSLLTRGLGEWRNPEKKSLFSPKKKRGKSLKDFASAAEYMAYAQQAQTVRGFQNTSA